MCNEEDATATPQIHTRVNGNIHGLRFSNPNVGKLGGGEVTIKADIRAEARQVGPNLHESAVVVRAEAKTEDFLIYLLELDYRGRFEVTNATPEELNTIVRVKCPTLLFPFVRRLVADITREGGYQPLLLEPHNFECVLAEQRQRTQPTANTDPVDSDQI